MKTPTIYSLDPEVVQRISLAAAQAGVSRSALVAYLVNVGFAERSPEHIQRWAAALRTRQIRSAAPKLRGSERQVLSELTDAWMKVQRPGKVRWRALQGLLEQGLAEVQPFDRVAKDSEGRPVVSFWRRSLAKPG